MEQAVALEKAYSIVKWLMERAARFPKNKRYFLGFRIEELALDILMGLVEANYSRDKAELLNRVNMDLDKIRFLARLCHDFHLFSITTSRAF